ncbi:SNF2 family N-terminal domain-containing protein [Delphinella strobiligena]|nr:SNF2 family N-terminal domain-containing protein [Delphinella strobiligena]
MSKLPPNASAMDMEDELVVQQTLLESLGDHDNTMREEIERTIAEIEDRLDSLGPGEDGRGDDDDLTVQGEGGGDGRRGSADSNSTTGSLQPSMPGAYPSTSQSVYQNGNGSNANMYHQPGATKRPFDLSANSPDVNDARVKRLTPNSSRSHTPLFMGSQPPMATQDRRAGLIERQAQREEAAKRRIEAEKADAAYAASFGQYPNSPPARIIPGPSRPPANTLSRTPTSPSQWQPIFRPRVKPEPQPSASPSPSPFGTLEPTLNSFSTAQSSYTAPTRNSYPAAAPSRPVPPSSVNSTGIHSNSYTLSPHTHSVKSERVKSETPRSLHSTPTFTEPTQVVDLTTSDDEAVIDLTRPNYPMPGQFNNGLGLGPESMRFQDFQRQRNMAIQRQQQQQQIMANHLQQQRAAQGIVYPGSSRNPAFSPLAQAAMSRMATVGDHTSGFMSDMSQINFQINNPNSESIDENYLRRALPGYTPRDDVVIDPEATREELRQLMDNIQPEEEDTIEEEGDIPVAGMTVKLKPYQMTGLKWLQKMESGNNHGGILADDMGLGKTVQAISLLVTNKSEDPVNKTNLIIAPVALLRQWKEEIEQKVRPGSHKLSTFLHHSSSKKKNHMALREYDVVLTTFGTLAAEQKRMDKFLLRKQHDPDAQPRDDEKCLFIGPQCKWFRVIIDEAQCIKNKTTRTAKAAYQLNARSRFCLTGTPMMNGVEELYSLVHFLKIKPYSEWQKFSLDFVKPLKGSNETSRDNAMRKLQALLKAILLRRNKQTKVNGKPILTLPERTIHQTHAIFNEDERALYTALETSQQIQFNKYLKAGNVGRSYAHILLLLLRLRQACCHPHLIKDFGVAAAAEITEDAMADLAKTLSEAVIERIKENDGTFECPVCFDGVENPAIFVPCGHKTCTECFTRIADPANGVANGDENGRSAKCPECRGPINTKSVIDYATFKKVHMAEPQPEVDGEQDPANAETDSEMDIDSDDSDDSDSDSDSDDDGDPTLDGFIVKDDVDSQAETDSEAETDSDGGGDIPLVSPKDILQKKHEKAMAKKGKKKEQKSKVKKSKKAKGKQKIKKPKKSNYSLSELKKLAGQSKKHKRMYMEKVSKDYIPSAKIEKTMDIVREIMVGQDQEKIIIFSQWTSLLDLLEIEIDRNHYGYRRYDGSMNAKMRGDAVDDFKTKSSVRMMLVSLKAGNAGLNLNIASQVIILDPFWNPYIEEQAIDRAHRLGQTRPVKVHRILVEDTVEDRILALQEKKRAVISEALDEKASKGVSRLSPQELAYLFGINRNMNDPLVIPGRARG